MYIGTLTYRAQTIQISGIKPHFDVLYCSKGSALALSMKLCAMQRIKLFLLSGVWQTRGSQLTFYFCHVYSMVAGRDGSEQTKLS